MTLFQLYKVSSYFQWAGSLLIALGCLLNYSVRPNYIKALGYYSIASILFSLAQEYARQSSSSELISTLGNGFVLSEALLLGLLYYFALQHTSFKRAMLVLSSLYIFFYIIVFFLYASHSFSYIRFGRDLLMVVFSIAYFYYLIHTIPEENLLKVPMFWINVGVIFFFSGTFILSLFRDYIVTVLKDDTSGFWAFRNFLRFAFCLVLSYAGWLDWRLLKLKRAP